MHDAQIFWVSELLLLKSTKRQNIFRKRIWMYNYIYILLYIFINAMFYKCIILKEKEGKHLALAQHLPSNQPIVS